MRSFLIAVVMVISTVFLFACKYGENIGNTLSSDAEVYATNISIPNTAKTYFVGDSFVLDSSFYILSPSSTTIQASVTIDKPNILSYENETNTVNCDVVGTAVIKITVNINKSATMFKTITVTVIPRPVYIDSLTVSSSNIEMNLGEEDFLNALSVTPLGSSKNIGITYSVLGIAQYDGFYVKALAEGTTRVTCTDTYTGKETFFDVTVTNYIYSTSVTPEKSTYCFALQDTGKISVEAAPANSNTPISFRSLNENILTISSDGSYTAMGVGTTTVEVTYYISKNNPAKVTIPIEVIQEVGVLSSSFRFNGQDRTVAFANNSLKHILTVTGDSSMLSDSFSATVNGVALKTSAAMKVTALTSDNNSIMAYEIIFYQVGAYVFNAEYLNPCEDGSTVSANGISVSVYSPITAPQITFRVDGDVYEKVEGKYNLSLTGEGDGEKPDSIVCSGVLSIDPAAVSLYSSGYTLKIVDNTGVESDGISYNTITGVVRAEKVGDYSIILTAIDDLGNTFVIPFRVTPVEVSDIKNGEADIPDNISLYLESANPSYPAEYSLLPAALPSYAYDTAISVGILDESIIAYVDGQIKAKGAGVASITISCGNIEKTITVTVNNYVSSIILTDASVYFNNELMDLEVSGESIAFSIIQGARIDLSFLANVTGIGEYNQFTFTYFNGALSSSKFSENSSCFRETLSLNSTGTGEETIIVTTQYPSSINIVIKITVEAYVEITSIEFPYETCVFNLADHEDRSFSVLPNIAPASGYHDIVTFESSNLDVAAVDNSGKVTVPAGVDEGTCTIRVLVNGNMQDTYALTIINKVFISNISSDYSSTAVNNIDAGTTATLVAGIYPTNATANIEYSSSNANIIIDADGTFRVGSGKGTCVLTVRYETAYGQFADIDFEFNILVHVESAVFAEETYLLDLNTTATITHAAVILPADHSDEIRYQSANTTIATVNNQGKVTGLSAGTTTISVLVNGVVKDTYLLTVIYDIFISDICSSTYSIETVNNIESGKSSSLDLIITPNNSTVSVSYDTSNSKISVNADGSFVVGAESGSCSIIVSYEIARGVFEEKIFEFNIAIHVTSVSFEEDEYSLGVGETATFSATISPLNHTDTIMYQSSDTDVATVDNTGKVTAVSAGTVTIIVLVNGEEIDSYTLTVETAVMTAGQVLTALYNNESITLTNDITLPDDFSTILSYSATFDGGEFTVYNLKKTFIVANTGTIKKLNLVACSTLYSSTTAVLCDTNSGTIEDVYITGTANCSVTGSFAGLVYTNSGIISRCSVNLTVTSASASGTTWAGLVYFSSGTISETAVSGNISNFSQTIGFIFKINGGTVSSCTASNMTINISTASKSIAAGFIYQDILEGGSGAQIIDCSTNITYAGGASDSRIGGFMFTHGGQELTIRAQIRKCTSKVTLSGCATSQIGLFISFATCGVVSNFGTGVNQNKYYLLGGYDSIYNETCKEYFIGVFGQIA